MRTKANHNEKKRFAKIMSSIAHNDKYALEEFYDTYGRLIYITALTVSKSIFITDEIIDDILIKIWQISKTNPKIQNPIGWLYTITANCAKDKLKNNKINLEINEIAYEDSNIERLFSDDSFYDMIKDLNSREQQIFIFRFVSDMSFKEIAKIIGQPISTVTSLYYRALEKIK